MADSSQPPPPPSQRRSAWKDLPRRLLTVCIGVPWIAFQMRYYVTSWLFFQGAHAICLLEWKSLLPSYAARDSKKNDDVTNPTINKPVNIGQRLLSILFDNQWQSSSSLEKCQFFIFSFYSSVITLLPTSRIPVALMFAGITLRMVQYTPTFQIYASQSIHGIQHYQFGWAYISVGFHFLLQIRRIGGPMHIGYLLFIVWMSDTGALIAGRLMKKKPGISGTSKVRDKQQCFFLSFLKCVSPGKTIPGLIGAVVTGPVSAILYPIDLNTNAESGRFSFLYINNPFLRKLILGLVLSVAGIVGDLAESSVKRMSGKKDSGGLLPGHGGVVDRFDSLFTAGIVYYCWILA